MQRTCKVFVRTSGVQSCLYPLWELFAAPQRHVSPGCETMYIHICPGYLDGSIAAGSKHPQELVNFPCTTQTWVSSATAPVRGCVYTSELCSTVRAELLGGLAHHGVQPGPRNRIRVRSGGTLGARPDGTSLV